MGQQEDLASIIVIYGRDHQGMPNWPVMVGASASSWTIQRIRPGKRRRRRRFTECHWHGPALIAGNAYVLAGLALFGLLAVMSLISSTTEERGDEPGRNQPDERRRLRVPAA